MNSPGSVTSALTPQCVWCRRAISNHYVQTTAGKMIFGRLWEEAENGHSDIHRTNGSSRRQMRDSRSGPHPVRITDGEPITEG